LRPSSARISSKETLRWGWVYVGASEGSRISVNLDVIVVNYYEKKDFQSSNVPKDVI
jgi:hypothetical protein